MSIIVGLLGMIGLTVLFVVVTDGRYFGKKLMYWLYDRFGPCIYGRYNEAERWRKMIKAVGLQGNETILDVGTATGELPLTLAAMPAFRGRIVGIDQSPRMIARAKSEASRRGLSPRVQFRVLEVRNSLPFSSYEFDVVFCIGLLGTLRHPELILRELQRVLKPGGTLVLSYYRGWPIPGRRWYWKQLGMLEFSQPQTIAFRILEDVVIVQRSGRDVYYGALNTVTFPPLFWVQ